MTTNNRSLSLLFGVSLLLVLPLQEAQAVDPPADQSLVSQVNQLKAQVTALQTQLANLAPIAQYVSLESVNDKPTVRFTGVNVQVVNGEGSTTTVNGTGNLIVGYDEPGFRLYRCTLGTNPSSGEAVVDEEGCASAGGEWLNNFKSGSHYLVLGMRNNYSRWGGLIAGRENTSNYDFANVSGGTRNTASGPFSTVSGGYLNTAMGSISSVSGGKGNTAMGELSSVSGGSGNQAQGSFSSVSGGILHHATGQSSSVSGGYANTASGMSSSILGGQSQNAAADYQTIPPLP